MNAAETIAAAIEKLESFHRGGADEWWREVEGPFATVLEHAATGTFTYVVARDMDEADADLIVTLHRTIDAQLAILRALLPLVENFAPQAWSRAEKAAFDLAGSILGETS